MDERERQPQRCIGIDAGSKTIKVVVMEDGRIVHSWYDKHRSDIKTSLVEALHSLVWCYGDVCAPCAVTGSAGIGLAEAAGLPFVQEVVATTRAVRHFQPDADAFIELGGEDAKIVYLTGGFEQRMNATCAGGTGGFIDTIAFMLDVETEDMGRLAMGAQRTYPIASRCAVFAQTDVRPLLNAGASKGDIAASVLDAVVAQTLGGLACGRPVRGNVVYLGGPFEYISGLSTRFNATGGLNGTKPADAHLFTAAGTALSAADGNAPAVSLAALEERLRRCDDPEDDLDRLPALFGSDEELATFRERHARAVMPRAPLDLYEGPAYLGLDAGSTTVKLALVDRDGKLLYSDYQPVEGDVVRTARDMLSELYRRMPCERGASRPLARIEHATATGYGEQLLRAAFGVDSGVVETTAHVRAACAFRPDATFVLDIGGQDMKALWVRDGEVTDAVLNEACSSGCGSFIEGTSYSLRLGPVRFADAALESRSPVDLGMKCTVFMTSRVRHAQKVGASVGDISAGIAYSVVRNALFRIIGRDRLASMGDVVVVQGGAFKSDAVLAAFEKTCGVEVLRPDTAHLMGAIGCALVARDRALARSGGAGNALGSGRWPMPTPSGSSRPLHSPERAKGPEGEGAVAAERAERSGGAGGAPGTEGASTLLGACELEALSGERRAATCPGCANACRLSIVSFDGRRSLISGNRCSRAYAAMGLDEARASSDGREEPPNPVAEAQRLLAAFGARRGEGPRAGVTVGLPATLEGHAQLPFWHTVLRELGFSVDVATSARGRAARVKAGESVPSESVCWPAKLSHERLYALLDAGADAVLAPARERGGDCAVACTYAHALADAVPEEALGACRLLVPQLRSASVRALRGCEDDVDELVGCLAPLCEAHGAPAVSRAEAAAALAAGEAAQREFEAAVRASVNAALAWVDAAPGRHAALLAGRPYHLDGDVLHGIDGVLAGFGFAPLPGFAPELYDDAAGVGAEGLQPGGEDFAGWSRFDHALAWAAERDAVEVLCLRSFGCGYDALGVERAREACERSGALFTALKIDGIADVAHVGIRLRTLAEAVEARDARAVRGGAPAEAPGAALDAAAPEAQPGGADPASDASALPARAGARAATWSPRQAFAAHGAPVAPPRAVSTPGMGGPRANVQASLVLPIDPLGRHPMTERMPIDTSRMPQGAPPVPAAPPGQDAARNVPLPFHAVGARKFWQHESDTEQGVTYGMFGLEQAKRRVAATAGEAAAEEAPASRPAPMRPLRRDDLELARSAVPADLCFTAALMTARAVADACGPARPDEVVVPEVCERCLMGALPSIVRAAARRDVQVRWTRDWPRSHAGTPLAQLLPAAPDSPPRIGLVGNPLLVFDEFMNDGLVAQLEALGCVAVMPPPELLYTDDVRYLPVLDAFAEAGVDHVVYLQSFCCLKGHVQSRGSLHELGRRYPGMPVTVIDYDAESAALSRENRVRLAVESVRVARPGARLEMRAAPRARDRWLGWAKQAAGEGEAQLLRDAQAWRTSGEAALAFLLDDEQFAQRLEGPELLLDALRAEHARCEEAARAASERLVALEGALGRLESLEQAHSVQTGIRTSRERRADRYFNPRVNGVIELAGVGKGVYTGARIEGGRS